MTKYADTLPEEAKPATSRITRYVYHVHGHAKLHPSHGTAERSGAEQQAVPFEVVLRRPFAIDSDSTMDSVRQDVRGHIAAELNKQGSPFIVGDVMVRGLNHLHTILVEDADPEGPAVRILA